MDARIDAIVSWKSGKYSVKEIGKMYNVSDRTIRRWKKKMEKGISEYGY